MLRARNAFQVLVLGALFAAWVQFARLPVEEQVTFIPDDGFYYLNIGANRAALGIWSFDHGISKTTGFHLLHAHVCALVAPLFSIAQTHALLGLHTFLAYVLTAVAALTLGKLAADAYGESSLPGTLLILATGATLSCPRMLMEWPYVVALYAVLLSAAARARWKTAHAAAFLLPIARTDAIVAVVATLAVMGFVSWRKERCLRFARQATLSAGASIAGVLVVCAFVYVQSGFFVQGNARMKAFLSARGILPGRILGVVTRAFAPAFWQIETPRPSAEILFLGVLVVGAGVLYRLSRERRSPSREPTPPAPRVVDGSSILLGSIAASAATTVLYALKVRAVMPWYCVYTIAPAALGVGAVTARLCRGRALAAGFGVAACALLLGLGMARVPIWPHQSRALAAAEWLSRHPEHAPAAAINAGIVGYFSDSNAVNIDGLVNDDIQPYYFAKRVECYFADRRIKVLIDQDCTGRPEAELWSQEDYPTFTSTLVDFGRAEGEPHCDVRAWRIDQSVLAKSCAPPLDRGGSSERRD